MQKNVWDTCTVSYTGTKIGSGFQCNSGDELELYLSCFRNTFPTVATTCQHWWRVCVTTSSRAKRGTCTVWSDLGRVALVGLYCEVQCIMGNSHVETLLWVERHVWKHYLSAASLVGSKSGYVSGKFCGYFFTLFNSKRYFWNVHTFYKQLQKVY